VRQVGRGCRKPGRQQQAEKGQTLDGTRSFFTGAHARRQEQTFYLQQIVRSSAGGRQSTGKDEASNARVGRIAFPNFIEILMVWQ
jgi:hypothetical protein